MSLIDISTNLSEPHVIALLVTANILLVKIEKAILLLVEDGCVQRQRERMDIHGLSCPLIYVTNKFNLEFKMQTMS